MSSPTDPIVISDSEEEPMAPSPPTVPVIILSDSEEEYVPATPPPSPPAGALVILSDTEEGLVPDSPPPSPPHDGSPAGTSPTHSSSAYSDSTDADTEVVSESEEEPSEDPDADTEELHLGAPDADAEAAGGYAWEESIPHAVIHGSPSSSDEDEADSAPREMVPSIPIPDSSPVPASNLPSPPVPTELVTPVPVVTPAEPPSPVHIPEFPTTIPRRRVPVYGTRPPPSFRPYRSRPGGPLLMRTPRKRVSPPRTVRLAPREPETPLPLTTSDTTPTSEAPTPKRRKTSTLGERSPQVTPSLPPPSEPIEDTRMTEPAAPQVQQPEQRAMAPAPETSTAGEQTKAAVARAMAFLMLAAAALRTGAPP